MSAVKELQLPDKETLVSMYRRMVQIRKYEDEIYYLFLQGAIPGSVHQSQGQEAVAVGVCSNLADEDYITTTHRPAGHCIAKGMSLRSMMAEMFAKSTGCCKGKGGAMHLGDLRRGVVPAIAIVGGGIPIATGIALSIKMRRASNVAVCFFGDGAANEGAFHEGINMAAIWNLPVIFVCENNLYGASTHISKVVKVENIADRAAAYGILGEVVSGNDVLAVRETAKAAIDRARSGLGPTLIECKTYRRGGHSRSDTCAYRPDDEEAFWLARDPIVMFREKLIQLGVLDEDEIGALEESVSSEVLEAVSYAKESSSPQPEDALRDVFYEGGDQRW